MNSVSPAGTIIHAYSFCLSKLCKALYLKGFISSFYLLFIYLQLLWVFTVARGLALVVTSRVYSLVAICERLTEVASLAVHAQQLWCTSSVAPWDVEFSRTRNRTSIPCIGRWILNRWATR